MFIWFKVKVDIPITELFERMTENNVILVPGYGFMAEAPVCSCTRLFDVIVH